jgi:type IV secretion system protein VirD4
MGLMGFEFVEFASPTPGVLEPVFEMLGFSRVAEHRSKDVTLYRQGGINFLGVFQNASAQIEAKYGAEVSRIWRKAVAHTIYRGLPDTETLKEIEHRSGKTSVMVRGFNISNSQVNGSGDNLIEQARPLLQVEDIREATGGEFGLLEARDQGYFTVEMPNFWERPELSRMLRDVRNWQRRTIAS